MCACFQVRAILARSTSSLRSVLVQAGRLTCRRRIIRGFRRSAFSAIRWDLLLGRSVSVPKMRAVLDGLVQSTRAMVERLVAKACQTRDEGENPLHSVRYLFVKMSR